MALGFVRGGFLQEIAAIPIPALALSPAGGCGKVGVVRYWHPERGEADHEPVAILFN